MQMDLSISRANKRSTWKAFLYRKILGYLKKQVWGVLVTTVKRKHRNIQTFSLNYASKIFLNIACWKTCVYKKVKTMI